MINDPVFVDRTGRRHRLMVASSAIGGLSLLLAVGALLAGFTGAGPAAVPGWPAPAATHQKTATPAGTARETAKPVGTGTNQTAAAPDPARRESAPASGIGPAVTPTPAATSAATAGATVQPDDRPTNRGRKPSSHPTGSNK